jgi:hypothetical protein
LKSDEKRKRATWWPGFGSIIPTSLINNASPCEVPDMITLGEFVDQGLLKEEHVIKVGQV